MPPGPTPSGALTAPATTNLFAAVVILVLFVLSAVVSAGRKDVTQGFDEVAHASYVAHIQASGQPWPALEQMRLLDPNSFRFTGTTNYLNHPPPFYDLLAVLGPKLRRATRLSFIVWNNRAETTARNPGGFPTRIART